jgi:hypothetical protein
MFICKVDQASKSWDGFILTLPASLSKRGAAYSTGGSG